MPGTTDDSDEDTTVRSPITNGDDSEAQKKLHEEYLQNNIEMNKRLMEQVSKQQKKRAEIMIKRFNSRATQKVLKGDFVLVNVNKKVRIVWRRKGKKPLEPLFSKPGQVLETSTNLSVKVVWKGTEDTEWIPSDRYKVVTQKIYDEVALSGNTEENNSVEGSNSESTNEHYSESQEGYVSHEISRDSIEESVETVDTSDLKDNYYMPTNSAGSDWFPEENMRVSIYMPYLKRH
jgi:hypothetical protein